MIQHASKRAKKNTKHATTHKAAKNIQHTCTKRSEHIKLMTTLKES